MKIAKIRTTVVLAIISVLSLICAVCLVFHPTKTVNAASGSAFFIYEDSEHVSSEITISDDKLNIPVDDGDEVAFKQELVVDNFGFNFDLPKNVNKLVINFHLDSFIATGNKNSEGEFDKIIANKLILETNGTNIDATFNEVKKAGVVAIGTEYTTIDLVVKFDKATNMLSATVNGNKIDVSADKYYKVACTDKPVAEICFTVNCATEESETIKVNSVSQNVSDDNYKQEFFGTDVKNTAYARVLLNDSFFVGNHGINENAVYDGKMYTVTPSVYSFGSLVSTNKLSISINDLGNGSSRVGKVNDSNTNTKLTFILSEDKASGNMELSFKNEDALYEKYTILVTTEGKSGEGEAPVFNGDADALESFKAELEKNLKTEYEVEGKTEEHYIRIGSDQYLTLPSMKSLVSDNLTSYENLTYSVHYMNNTDSSEYSSDLKIPVVVAGNYTFFVVFTDECSNSMEVKDFFEYESDGITPVYGKYKNLIINFILLDDAPILVTPSEQGKGYAGADYVGTEFTIVASSYTTEHKLYYSATADAEEDKWVEIIKAEDATIEDKEYNGYTYQQIKDIGYNGVMSFTPDKIGYYKIICTVKSANTDRSASAEAVITVEENASPVYPPSTWLADNVWSVVFLSIGTLSLIGIIVLLFIKPKEKTETANVKVRVIKEKKSDKDEK